MPKRIPSSTSPPRERAFMVGVEIRGKDHILSMSDSLAELARLCDTAGLEVVGQTTQKLDRQNPQTLIGSGKIEELIALAEETLTDVIVFDDELIPRHQRELETLVGTRVRVIDRTALILDIFAQHAHTSEGQLQVKLAQSEYYLPRLTGRWTHLARQAGGGGGRAGSVGGVGLRGPGETQLEVDRRAIRHDVLHIKEELEKVRVHRDIYRTQRKRSRLPTIALVGYTNSGKSTLLNQLAKADVLVADQLFATLDPTTRRVHLSPNELALFTDTVGFIQKLPTTLVSAFHATLEEISDADLLVHVIDISHPNAMNQAEAVNKILKEIGAGHIPVVAALNKMDLLADPNSAQGILTSFPRAILLSALTGEGLGEFVKTVRSALYESFELVHIRIPYKEGQLISLFHEQGQIDLIENGRTGVTIKGRIPGRFMAQFSPWKVNSETHNPKDDLNENLA